VASDKAASLTPGYVLLESNAEHPGLIRVANVETRPDPEPVNHHASRIHCVIAFDDGDAAVLHFHEALKRRLVDPDTRLYRAPVEQGIAALDAIDLRHRVLYLDCDFSSDQRQAISDLTARYRGRKQRVKKIFDAIGYIAFALLLFNLLVLSRH
jgi:hypothetical protein